MEFCRTSNAGTSGTLSGRTGCPHRSVSVGSAEVGARPIWTTCTTISELPSSSMVSPHIRPSRAGWTCAGTASSLALGSSPCAIAGLTSRPGHARSRAKSAWCCGSVVGRVRSAHAELLARRCSRDHGRRLGPGGPRSAALGAGAIGPVCTSQRAARGGRVRTADAGRPCQGSSTAATWPMLPTPLPP